ncbi:MAG: transcriptional regulator [Candidatus Thorarchaeota archaeon]
MRPPGESIATIVLPAFRSLVTRELVERLILSQVEAARRLGITQAAISQYLNQKGGSHLAGELESVPVTRSAVLKLAENIAAAPSTPVEDMMVICNVCEVLRTQRMACSLHHEAMDLPDDCRVCLD